MSGAPQTPRPSHGASRLASFSLERRITVLVLFVSALVVGAVATVGVPVELFPGGWEAPFLGVYVPWENAPAQEVLEKLTEPLEEELSTVRGLERIVSFTEVGRSRAWIVFKQGTDLDVAYREVRDRLERARRRFPSDADRVFIFKEDPSSIPVLVLGITLDEGLADPWNLVQKGIVRRLERVEGVASIEVQGLEEKEILIELDRELTEAAGLNIYDLSERLADDNFTMPSGRVYDATRKLLLRSVATLRSVEEVSRIPVTPDLRLGEIARISYEEPEKEYRVRANGKPAVAVVALKDGDANARAVSRRLADVVDELGEDARLAGTELFVLLDQGAIIDEALGTVLRSGAIGGILAAVVLAFFLRRLRLTLIIGLSIPLSIVVALTVLFLTGDSLNLISLLGLMICVGLLVDNSVVVAENIHRLHQSGASRREAAIRGASEIALAITMSTLTTIVVFLPSALVDGNARFFLVKLAMPITVALLASLGIALVFVPLAVYLTLPNGRGVGWPPTLRRGGDRVRRLARRAFQLSFGLLQRAYGRVLALSLTHRFEVVIGLALVFALTVLFPGGKVFPERAVGFTDVQEKEEASFQIEVSMPPEATFEETEAWFLEAEAVVASHVDDWGLDGYFHFHRRDRGEIEAWFTSPRTTELTAKEATKLLLEELPAKAGVELTTGLESQVVDEKGDETWRLRLYGEDAVALDETARSLRELLARVEGVVGVRKVVDPPPNELGIVIDRERSRRYGADPQVVAGVVGYALRGRALPRFHQAGREIPVRIRFREEDRESLADLNSFYVPTEAGAVPLSAVTDARPVFSPAAIIRRDKKMMRTVTVELAPGDVDKTRERLDRLVSGVSLPEGVSFQATARRDGFSEDMENFRFALALSVIFIYLLMGFLFESFILPLSIVLTMPLAALGVWWIHFFSGQDVDFLGAIGILLLVGVVVNNGIVLIDTVRSLRRAGRDRVDALLVATERRFRPIMMTAITTIGGMVPLAFAGANSIGLSYTSFSLTLIGGMSSATLLTLLVVPVFYTFFDDLGLFLMRGVAAIVRRPGRAESAV